MDRLSLPRGADDFEKHSGVCCEFEDKHESAVSLLEQEKTLSYVAEAEIQPSCKVIFPFLCPLLTSQVAEDVWVKHQTLRKKLEKLK